MSRKTILIGCGGSGITTMMRFNEMLAGNRQWRDRLWEEVSYLIVDTEVSKTITFKELVKEQLGRARTPIVKLAQITRGYDTLGEIIAPNFEDENDPEKAELLRPYWWYSPDGEPYRAHRRRHIQRGAGQCCPISYMTMWKYLPQLRKDLQELFDTIRKHNIGADDPLNELRVYIVAGLAGGTGRGCWSLVAFAVRQYIKERFGKDVAPVGIFFDASCFPNKDIQKDPDQVHSMRVNSMTGISELDAWIRLASSNQDYYYTLPQLSSPREANAIKVDPSRKPFDSSEKSPVEAAYLIFGDNGRGVLGSNEEYHEMAAAALYSLVVGARYIDPGEINRVHDYGSFASASFEVETVKLRAYFESVLREAAIRDMIADVGKDDAKISEILGMGKNAGNENSFFYRTGLNLSEPFDANSLMSPQSADALDGSTILQRVISKIRAYRPNVVEEFAEIIKKQNVGAGWTFAENAFGQFRGQAFAGTGVAAIPDSEIQKAVDAAFADVGLADVSSAFVSWMTTLYSPEGRGSTQSVGRLLAAANVLAAPRLSRQVGEGVFDKSVANLGSADGIVCGKFRYLNSKAVRDVFKRVYDNGAKKNFFEFKPFNKSDLTTLRSSFALHLNLMIFFRVRNLIAAKYNIAIDAIEKIRSSVGLIAEALRGVSRAFVKSARVGCRITDPSKKAYDELFVKPDLDSVDKSIPEADETELCYRRALKPIVAEEEIKSLLLNTENVNPSASINRRAIKDVMSREIVRLIQNASEIKPHDELASLKAIFTELFKSNVILERDFMDRNFSFEGVLRKNVEWWDRLLAAHIGDLDTFDKLTDRFRAYLGVDRDMLFDDDGTDPLPHIPLDKLLKSILVSLVGTCKPWIQLRNEKNRVAGDYCVTLALAPVEIDNVAEYEDAIESAHPTQFPKIIHQGSTSVGKYELPRDRIVVFASQGVPVARQGTSALDRISSVDYWKKDAELKASLMLAESPDGMSFFEVDDGKYRERDIGLGYPNPIYLTEAVVSNLRWKPWAPRETVSEARKREMDVCKALLYAFCGNGLAEGESDIGGIASELSWPLPLVTMGKGEVFSFTRLPLEWKVASSKSEKTGGKRAAKRAWSAGDNLAVSIDNVFRFLLGKGRPGEEGTRLAASAKKGGEILSQLLAEAQAFEDNVSKELTPANRRKLVEALQNWLDERKCSASKGDAAYWEKLIDMCAKE